jgi:hypothetical protein
MPTYVVFQPTMSSAGGAEPLASRKGVDAIGSPHIGLLCNSKANADVFLAEIEQALLRRFPAATFSRHTKLTASKALGPVGETELRNCDMIVNAFGDCGSCSSWSVHDGIALERAGIPTATVITEPFAYKSRFEAESLGFGDLPLVVLPHTWDKTPLGQLPDDAVRSISAAVYPEVEFIVTASAEDVAAAYRKNVDVRTDSLTAAR